MVIKHRKQKLLADLEKVQEKLKALTEECEHKDYTYFYGDNTGNYDPTEDVYWTDYVCLDCGKTDQVKGSQSKFEGKRIGV